MNQIKKLFENIFQKKIENITALPQSGSYRKYYKIFDGKYYYIATYNSDKTENEAFISFSKHFFSKKLPVPEILAENLDENIYFQTYLGETTFFYYIKTESKNGVFSQKLIKKYKEILEILIQFQVEGAEGLDFSKCYPRSKFDEQSIIWDLNYFKYYMLKIAKVPFNEQLLENDFNEFIDYLLTADTNFFLYRDFQSRNIMLKDEKPYFIDYQGGRQGAFFYDLASLMYDAKANIPQPVRDELVEHYFSKIQNYKKISEKEFYEFYYAYALIRIMQAFGAYGFRGLIEKKSHFIKSIPPAIANLKFILENKNIVPKIPELRKALHFLINESEFSKIDKPKSDLKITIKSFSFLKKGYPADSTGNGGGFVFDCRFLPNPGRIEKYKSLSGLDFEVKLFLDAKPEVETFLQNTYFIVKQAINNYIERKFDNLAISFGCTGGQHRSVYSAEKIKEMIEEDYNIKISLSHENSNNWHTRNTK